MAKKLLNNYDFTPGNANVGNIKVTGKYHLNQFLLITNTTDNAIIYNFASPTYGGTATYDSATNVTTLVFKFSTSGMSSTDALQVFVDDTINEQQISPTQTYQDPVEKMRVSNPQALIDTDFEYSLQSTKWESVQLQNNIPGIFQRANEPAFQGSEITSILPAGGGLTGSATSTTYTINGRTSVSQVYSGNRDDGNYIVNLPFTFNFLNTNYTRVYVGTNGYITFGAGSNAYSGVTNVDNPNLPAIKLFAADRRLYYLATRTIGSAPNRTFIVRWEGTNFSPSLTSGGFGSHIAEVRFLEGQNAVEVHYERVQSFTAGGAGIQDGSGPSTTYLASWTPNTNATAPYTTGQGFRVGWGSGGTSLEVTVANAPAAPFTVGSPVILKETKDTLYLDGAFLITNVPSTTKFRIDSRSPTAYSGDQKTDYTTLYTGGFFSSASMSVSSIQQITGTTRARINFSSNHGLYVGSKLYVVDTSAGSTAAWPGAVTVSRVISNTAVEYNTTSASNFGSTTTVSTANTRVYARNEGIAQHRYFDGGVQINPASNSPNAQIIRQTRKYFRYQSGKGIQFSTGVLFRPVYDVSVTTVLTNTYEAGTNEFYDMTITTDQEHGFTSSSDYLPGAKVRISGYTVASGVNPYNGEFEIQSIVDRVTFTVKVPVSGTLPTDTSPDGIPKIEVIEWKDAVVRSGMFDDQNGIFFEHDGEYLYTVKRSSTEQIAGRIAVNSGSSTVVGTNTKFLTQLKEEDYIVIKGSSYIVTKITNDTNLTISPDYRASSISDAKIVKTNDDRTRQDAFNIDKVDGTGPSGYNLDANKMQMVFLDYSWYGAGKIRWGVRTSEGRIQYIHELKQNNVNTEAYMRSGNIPGRFEIQSKSKSGKLLTNMGTASTAITVNEAEAAYLPQSGTIVINNEYITYNKGTLSGSNRTLNFVNRNVGGLSSSTSASVNDTWLSVNQNCSPSLSHWGVSVLMDGRFDTDKSYLFTAPTRSAVSVPNNQSYALVSLRLAPSVDYGIPGFYGIRNLINRSEIILDSIGLSVNGNFSVEIKINPENTLFTNNANWIKAPNGSIGQYIDHSVSGQGTFSTTGDAIAAFFAEEGSNKYANSTYILEAIRGLSNSIIGGPGVYPDGPDVLTIFVKNVSGATRNAFGRVSWTESQG